MTDEPAAAADSLDVLLRVQDLDTTLTQLERRKTSLPERSQLQQVERGLLDVEARSSAVEQERGALAGRQAELEAHVEELSSRRSSIEQRMYSTRGGPARDLQAMDEEVRHLTARRAELEDVELEIMEQLEPLDTELASLAVQRAELLARGEGLRAELAAAEAIVDGEAAEVAARRGTEVAALPTALRDRYETIRDRMGGIGAARLIGNRCSGCHLELPSMEVDRIRRLPPGSVITCDQCGRILVPTSSGDAGTRPAR